MINHLIENQLQSNYLTVVKDQLSAKKTLHYYKSIWGVSRCKIQTVTIFIFGKFNQLQFAVLIEPCSTRLGQKTRVPRHDRTNIIQTNVLVQSRLV